MSITRRRPGIPASYQIAQDEVGMLEWTEVASALDAAPVYWVATVTPSGGPHLIPIWGAWVRDTAFIEGGDETRWARNLAGGDGRVHLGADHEGMQIMVRGVAMIADSYEAKYPSRPEGARFWRIAPEHVLAWRVVPIDAFASTPTEFVFLD